MAVFAKFPNVRSFSVEDGGKAYDALQLVTYVLSRQLFYCLGLLECLPNCSTDRLFFSLKELRPLLEHANLPSRVLILPSDSFAAKDPDFLVSLYGIMKTNPAQFLLMKGPLHPQALVRLEEVLSNDREVKTKARVLAWTDKDLPEERGIGGPPALALPDFTDVKISGVKNAGLKNGEEFTIRICHQHTQVTSYII